MLHILKQFSEIRANTHEYTHEDQENVFVKSFLEVFYKSNLEFIYHTLVEFILGLVCLHNI